MCEEFGCLLSQLDDEDPNLLMRIMQLRSFESSRQAMKSDKEREKDAKPHGPMAEIVAKVQFANQHGIDPETLEE
jgi:hypothetical protein